MKPKSLPISIADQAKELLQNGVPLPESAKQVIQALILENRRLVESKKDGGSSNSEKTVFRYDCSHYTFRNRSWCQECFEKQIKIDRLEEINRSLNARLNARLKKDDGEAFGSSTPSSKQKFKKNSKKDKKKKQGGSKQDRKGGSGRHIFDESDADQIIKIPFEEKSCPDCGGILENQGKQARAILDTALMEIKKILYHCPIRKCKQCSRKITKHPLVMPRSKYGNSLISNAIVMHFLEGIPLKRLEKMWGPEIIPGNLRKIFHKLAQRIKPAIDKLKEDLREKEVIHADETGWRTNGHSGYSWLFCCDDISLFAFKDTRSAKVVDEFLSTKSLNGVLVVDRYAGYNKAPLKLQYCYEHLKRTLDDLLKEFPNDEEVKVFHQLLRPLVCKAMKLRNQKTSDRVYYQKAKKLKQEILNICRSSARHLGIESFQNIFLEKEDRLFQWVENRKIPAENNKAEREIRPTVIARKVSFGSQSEQGAKTRSILMSYLHTASKRLKHESITHWFKTLLDEASQNSEFDFYSCLPP